MLSRTRGKDHSNGHSVTPRKDLSYGSHAPQRAEVSDEQLQEIDHAFNAFAMSGKRHLRVHELKCAMRALGFQVQLSDANKAILDHGSDGSISKEAFTLLMKNEIAKRDPEEEVMRAFNLFADEKTNEISVHNLKKVAKDLGEPIDEQELQAMIDEFDLTGTGTISYEEFKQIVMDE